MLSAAQIVAENALPGSADWEIDGKVSTTIQGYAAQFSVNHGETVQFKVDTVATDYRIDIYRMGWYQGLGGRLVATVQPTNIQQQPDPIFHLDTNSADASNWHVSASWAVPTNAVSGVYLGKLVREDGSSGANYVIFVVRDDEGQSDLLFQTSDETWQAYNTWGGSSLYAPNYPNGRAYAVSYSRPFNTRDDTPLNFYFGEEMAMTRFLERNGYDVSYTSGIDTDRRGEELLEHKVFMSVGHDEYWSGQQRANVEAARDAGVNLAFFSGNEMYWKTRWGTDSTGTPYTTLISYKETLVGAKIDPLEDVWTGTWRDPRFSSTTDGGRPENALTGTIFKVNSGGDLGTTIDVSSDFAALRFWRNTVVATLDAGESVKLGDRALGYEWDEDPDNGFRPAGLIPLSSTTRTVPEVLKDYGATFGKGTATHSMTLYRAASGALVFSAGSIQYSWGLDDKHPVYQAATDPALQQATVNLFADMGVQPGSLMSGIIRATASNDLLAPISTMLSPVAGAFLPANTSLTVRGTAQDQGGGVIAVVEVSIDGGNSWHRATGKENWTYTFTTRGNGPFSILSRAVDDSGNLERNGPRIDVNPNPNPGIWSLWSNSDVPSQIDSGDAKAIEVGVRFTSDVNGYITGLRFYKAATNTGSHIANLWTNSGQLLATAKFTSETTSGWQQVNFDTPVAVTAGVSYVASYFAPKGHYSANLNYFATQGVSNGSLHANPTGPAGTNGIYRYGSTSGFPTLTSKNTNYWVDVVLNTIPNNDHTAPTVDSFEAADGSETLNTNSSIVIKLSEALDAKTVSTNTIQLLNPDPNSVPGGCCSTPGGWCSGCPLVMGANTKVISTTVTYDSLRHSITLTPKAPLLTSSIYTVLVVGGEQGVTDLAGNPLAADTAASFLTPAQAAIAPASIWSTSAVPSVVDGADARAIEVGTRFTADVNGLITGLRFYKSAKNTGTHVGNLWTSTGQLIATGTFANETASGWQQLNFAAPVAITAGTTYVASYHTDTGHYAADINYFTSQTNSGSLHVPVNGGVYVYGAGGFPTSTYKSTNYWVDVVFQAIPVLDSSPPTAVSFTPAANGQNVGVNSSATVKFSEAIDPTSITVATVKLIDSGNNFVTASLTYNAATMTATLTPTSPLAFDTTYTIVVTGGAFGVKDVAGNPIAQTIGSSFTTVAAPVPDLVPPTVTAVSPANGSIDISTGASFTVTFNEGLNAATVDANSVLLLKNATNRVNASLSYNAANRTVTITPLSPLEYATTYTIYVPGGASGVADLSGNEIASDFISSFTTSAAPVLSSIWQNTATPSTVDGNDGNAIEVGVKFTSDVNGYITGLRFYKSSKNTGTHIANLWTSTGQLLATTKFTSETATGWQQVNFATPVAITAGTTYVASYFAPKGHYSADLNAFASALNSGPLHVAVGGGVYRYGTASGFPKLTYKNTNYWVDVVLSSTPAADTTLPTVTGNSPANGATNVSTGTAVTVFFSEAMNTTTINNSTVKLLDGNSLITSSVVYNANNNSVTITPIIALSNSKTYTISVLGGIPGVKDVAGNPLAQTYSSTFTTASAASTSSTIWPTSTKPNTVSVAESDPVEVGVSFTADVNGYITGVRFYKAAGNTGTHIANLWTSTGQLLATATFASETASGWQQVDFATPVAITAGTKYIASYFAPNGHFSVDRGYFDSQLDSGHLHVGVGGGVFQYGSSSAFPTQSYQNSNYWVDVLFTPGS